MTDTRKITTYPVTLPDGSKMRVTVPDKPFVPECLACAPGCDLCPMHAQAQAMADALRHFVATGGLSGSNLDNALEGARALLRALEGERP